MLNTDTSNIDEPLTNTWSPSMTNIQNDVQVSDWHTINSDFTTHEAHYSNAVLDMHIFYYAACACQRVQFDMISDSFIVSTL
jgi:hypothetical protein